ncbi:protein ANTAGONIST OF LIKE HETEROCHROMATIN PROTEIN 1-like [Lucilia cuprina]|uniref:protein ANTAGONIST OF LIKE HETEROCHROMATIN PROTEIN 1-like n=1 Tax=Lucilia cuprina TaxID=7375 RepID=UPI001F05CF23|nr:protein ANTAGONIST OF LIKE HETEROCHROMATIN PROTEIN 1-like [Lucilia cuprina]
MKKTKKRNLKRSIWVREWLTKRNTDGAYKKALMEFREIENQHFLFNNFLRMNDETFKELLHLVSPYIAKQDTNMRKAIPAQERLAVTLRFLASGDSYKRLSVLFRIAPNTISLFVSSVCDAIYKALKGSYLKVLSTQEEWNEVAFKFNNLWNFPNCIGAVDGKHVQMVAPPNSGSTFYNYKGTHSIVLMAVVDAEYNFLYVDVGCNGRVSDGGVFGNCSFQCALDNNDLNLPPPKPLPGRQASVPFVLVADDAFRMQKHLLKPYPGKSLSAGQRIFNYRLSRARRIVENAFGIMAKRFQVFACPSKLNAEKTTSITLACCALHNFLLKKR